MEAQKKNRKENFSDHQIRAMLNLIHEHSEILNSKLTNTVTNNKKNSIWMRIAADVNACGTGGPRTVTNIKKKWFEIKAKGVKAGAARKKPKTGGGGPPVEPWFTDIVLDILGQETALLEGHVEDGADTGVFEVEEFGDKKEGTSCEFSDVGENVMPMEVYFQEQMDETEESATAAPVTKCIISPLLHSSNPVTFARNSYTSVENYNDTLIRTPASTPATKTHLLSKPVTVPASTCGSVSISNENPVKILGAKKIHTHATASSSKSLTPRRPFDPNTCNLKNKTKRKFRITPDGVDNHDLLVDVEIKKVKTEFDLLRHKKRSIIRKTKLKIDILNLQQQREKIALEREQIALQREQLVLQREQLALDQEQEAMPRSTENEL